ncbi:hypothetical protein H0H81_004288 [Sphagnurus paluster]|uniref:Uncharacterized protein n=1 Tax=Sphagnurus paluster TaxID=117069 RepID=A0A9P7GQU3_9AGAR|nr:hypothetical protein H0H81_004288 [Sphagnurus paluster]
MHLGQPPALGTSVSSLELASVPWSIGFEAITGPSSIPAVSASGVLSATRAFLALNRFKKSLTRIVRHTIAILRNVKMVVGIVTHKALNLKEHLVASAPQKITTTKESFDGLVTCSHGAFKNIVKDAYRIVEQLGDELERTIFLEPLLFFMHDLPERRHWNTVNRTATVAEASAVRRTEKIAQTSLLWPAAFIAIAEPLDSRRDDSILPFLVDIKNLSLPSLPELPEVAQGVVPVPATVPAQFVDFPTLTWRKLKWSEILRAKLGITALAYMLGAIQVPSWEDCENFLADWVVNSVKDQTCKAEAIPEIRNESENQDNREVSAGDEEDECLFSHDDADYDGAADLSWHSEDLEFGENIEESMCKFG